MIYYISTSFNRSFILVFITYVSYTDIEIEFETSDEEFTDSVGKLKVTKYILVFFIAGVNVLIKVGHSHDITG